MAISSQLLGKVCAGLYEQSLRKVPGDTRQALQLAGTRESNPVGRAVLTNMEASAAAAEAFGHFVCSDAGIPVYFVRIGSRACFDGPVKAAIVAAYAELVATIRPPLLTHVTNPLTLERGHFGKDMPIITFEVIDDADHVEIVCSPKALGSGQWAGLKIFPFPPLQIIEDYVIEVLERAGSQPCPPVVIGVGIGGTFDYAAKLSKQAILRPIGTINSEPLLAEMESRLLTRANATGFGPMGTGGDSTAMAVHVEYAASHGFVPVAVSFNCWINRRRGARIHADGRVDYFE